MKMANDRKLPRQPPPLPPKSFSRWIPDKWITEAGYGDDARYVSVYACVAATTRAILNMLENKGK